MYLTREEERMLAGEYGAGIAKSLELLVSLGDVFGAEKLVPVESAHISGVSFKNLGEAGVEWLEDQVKYGAKCRVRATLNPAGMDMKHWREMGVPEEFAVGQNRTIRAFEALGVEPTCTCTPYLVGHTPRFGAQIAWAESSAICYSNSVIGARTNRESGPTTIASAVTGLTPLYEYRLKENRRPSKIVDVTADLNSALDYSALGYVTGKLLGKTVPYFRGLGYPDLESLKTLGAACATSGGIALWHGEGVTPEAKEVEPHLRGLEKIIIDKKAIREAKEMFTCELSDPVVCIGCPHCSLREIGQVAKIVKGGKLRKRTMVFTSRGVYSQAQGEGYVRSIEDAGGHVYVDTCMVVAPLKEMGWKEVALNSFKGAQYCANMGLKTSMATVEGLLEEAQK
jgi:predicted aconitase